MQIIKKTINLEPFKTRFSDMKIPACGDNAIRCAKWGEIPKDIVDSAFTRYEKTFPLVEVEGKLVLRFRRAVEIFSFLKHFINQSKFYRLCKRNSKLQWNGYDEDILSDAETISEIKDAYEYLPNTEGFELGDIIWVGKGINEFRTMFQIGDDTLNDAIENAKKFAIRIWDIFYNEGATETSEPYLPIDLLITQDCDDMGLMSPAASEWIPNKKYYLGECVVYEEQSYRLKATEEGFDYYKGNFVPEDKITYFDDVEYGRIVLNHWEKVGGGLSQTEKINGFAESRLRSLIRFKKDFDDDGNELPFILRKEGEEVAGADLLYVEGLKFNIKTVEGITFCDYIDKIKEDGRGEITFTYYIGATMDEDGRIDRESGVKYEETYPCTKKTWSGYYDKKLITVEYTEIEYVNQIWDPSLEAEEGKIYARVTYPISGNEDFVEIPYIKRDSLMGIQDYTANIDNIKISRGKAAAFELHNILGEVQTFEDLETYRNDFFNVKSNEIRQ